MSLVRVNTPICLPSPELWDQWKPKVTLKREEIVYLKGTLSGSYVSSTSRVTIQPYTHDSGYTIETGDIIWIRGTPLIVETINTQIDPVHPEYVLDCDVSVHYQCSETDLPTWGAGDKCAISRPQVWGNIGTQGGGGNYEKGPLDGAYDYVCTITTSSGYETNPCAVTSIAATKQKVLLTIGDLPYTKELIKTVNIYRTFANMPGDYYFVGRVLVTNIDPLYHEYIDVADPDYDTYTGFRLPFVYGGDFEGQFGDIPIITDNTDYRQWYDATTSDVVFKVLTKTGTGYSLTGACCFRDDATATVTTRGISHRTFTQDNEFKIFFKLLTVPEVAAAPTEYDDVRCGVCFNMTDDANHGWEDTNSGKPLDAYELFFYILAADPNTIRWTLCRWIEDANAFTSLSSGTFAKGTTTRITETPVYGVYNGGTGSGNGFEIYRDNKGGTITVRRYTSATEYAVMTTVRDITSREYCGIGLTFPSQLQAVDETHYVPVFEYVQAGAPYGLDYLDETPDENLGHRLHDYKIVPQQATDICQLRDLLVVAYGKSVYVSEPSDPETFYKEIVFEEPVVAVEPLNLWSEVAVFLKTKIYRLSVDDLSNILATRTVSALSPSGVLNCGSDTGVVFVASTGIYSYNGASVQELPNFWKVRALFNGTSARRLNENSLKYCRIIFRRKKNHIIFVLGENNSLGDLLLIYDYNKQAWLFYKFEQFGVTAGVVYDDDGTETVYLAGSNGEIYIMSDYYFRDGDAPVYVLAETGEIGFLDHSIRARAFYAEIKTNASKGIILVKGNYDREGYKAEPSLQIEANSRFREESVRLRSDVVNTYQVKITNANACALEIKRLGLVLQQKLERNREFR